MQLCTVIKIIIITNHKNIRIMEFFLIASMLIAWYKFEYLDNTEA